MLYKFSLLIMVICLKECVSSGFFVKDGISVCTVTFFTDCCLDVIITLSVSDNAGFN